ncbi:MAG TPA: hypothetical protein VII87_03320, partial [Solirubrobacteraceae bacterium]
GEDRLSRGFRAGGELRHCIRVLRGHEDVHDVTSSGQGAARVDSVYGGVLAERTERIRLMVGSDLLSGLWQVGIAIVAATAGPPAVALVFTALTAATTVVY